MSRAAKMLLGCFKSSRNFFSRYFFHEVPKETHNIFKDFEDEMALPEKFFSRNFTLVHPYVKSPKNIFPVVNNDGLYFEE
jgi:hypothetical protein